MSVSNQMLVNPCWCNAIKILSVTVVFSWVLSRPSMMTMLSFVNSPR